MPLIESLNSIWVSSCCGSDSDRQFPGCPWQIGGVYPTHWALLRCQAAELLAIAVLQIPVQHLSCLDLGLCMCSRPELGSQRQHFNSFISSSPSPALHLSTGAHSVTLFSIPLLSESSRHNIALLVCAPRHRGHRVSHVSYPCLSISPPFQAPNLELHPIIDRRRRQTYPPL